MSCAGSRHTLLAAIALCMLAAPAGAQTWPAKPVRILVPFAAGGGVDSVTRIMAQKMTEQLGSPVIVENRVGGAGVLAAELTSKAPPDGYTFFTSAPEFAINPAIRSKPPYDPFRDFTYISMIASGVFMLASHPSVPVHNVKQLIALAKARPGQLNYGSSGTGGINHLSGELFQSMAGIRWVHVPFKGGGPSVAALMGGEVDFVFASAAAMVGASRAGKIRPIGVTGAKRFGELPDVPTISESGLPGYDVLGWYGMYGPPGMSPDLVKRVHAAATSAMTSPDVKDRLTRTGTDAVMSSPEAFASFMRTEIAKWTQVVKAAKLTID